MGVDTVIYLRLLLIPAIVFVLWFLSMLLTREWVKTDLRNRGLQPLQVRWWPWTWWSVCGPIFRVRYVDADGFVHQALCGLANWHRPIRWRDDKVIADMT
jgi:hypothetical protein